jgi:acyl-CoA thioesterase YciA
MLLIGGIMLISSHICMTKDVGCHGNLFGGILMSWLDEAGALAAMQYANTPNMVTLKIGELSFKKPVKAHDVIRIYYEIAKTGRTSVTIKLKAQVVHLATGKEELVATTEMVFVRIDNEGKATPIFPEG